jgi:hypothetical protein
MKKLEFHYLYLTFSMVILSAILLSRFSVKAVGKRKKFF